MAEIRFEPICSNCGKRIFGMISLDCIQATIYSEPTKTYKRDQSISPCQCPYCGERFSSIVMPTQLPYDNTKELKYYGT